MARKKQYFDEGIAKRIKETRMAKGYSRPEFAKELCKLACMKGTKYYNSIACSVDTLKLWEGIGEYRRTPDALALQAIAEVLQVDYLYLLNGNIEDIIEKSRSILKGFEPSDISKEINASDLFYYKGISIEKEVAETIAIYFPLSQNGHKPQDIADTKQFLDYMKVSNKNAIEFYMNNLNKGKEEE